MCYGDYVGWGLKDVAPILHYIFRDRLFNLSFLDAVKVKEIEI